MSSFVDILAEVQLWSRSKWSFGIIFSRSMLGKWVYKSLRQTWSSTIAGVDKAFLYAF